MNFENIFWAFLGIFTTILTFIFTYKQTIGARKERAKTAYKEIMKSLYRNLILEDSLPSLSELNRIITSKITEHRIKEIDIPTGMDFYDDLYTKLFEDGLIDIKLKNKEIDKINQLVKIETQKDNNIGEISLAKNKEKESLFLMFISIIMGFVVFFISFGDVIFNIKNIVEIILFIMGGLIVLYFTNEIIKNRAKEPSESPIRKMIRERREFEEEVFKKIKEHTSEIIKEVRYFEGGKHYSLDFEAKKENQKYGIEIISFRGKVIPSFILERLKNSAIVFKKINPKMKLILITRGKIIADSLLEKLKDWDFIIESSSFKQDFKRIFS